MIMLRELRLARGMTQTELAKKIGTDLRTVGNWERGITVMNIAQACDCAVALGCTPNDICGWEEYIDEDKRNLDACYDAMDDKGRAALTASAFIISELSGAKDEQS